jgi:hypothetical protein
MMSSSSAPAGGARVVGLLLGSCCCLALAVHSSNGPIGEIVHASRGSARPPRTAIDTCSSSASSRLRLGRRWTASASASARHQPVDQPSGSPGARRVDSCGRLCRLAVSAGAPGCKPSGDRRRQQHLVQVGWQLPHVRAPRQLLPEGECRPTAVVRQEPHLCGGGGLGYPWAHPPSVARADLRRVLCLGRGARVRASLDRLRKGGADA